MRSLHATTLEALINGLQRYSLKQFFYTPPGDCQLVALAKRTYFLTPATRFMLLMPRGDDILYFSFQGRSSHDHCCPVAPSDPRDVLSSGMPILETCFFEILLGFLLSVLPSLRSVWHSLWSELSSSSRLWLLALALTNEVTPCALRSSDILKIALLGTLDPLCFTLVCYLEYSPFNTLDCVI